jgi:hypothetical protein
MQDSFFASILWSRHSNTRVVPYVVGKLMISVLSRVGLLFTELLPCKQVDDSFEINR